MHGVIDGCLAVALVLLAGAEALHIEPLAFLGGGVAAFHLWGSCVSPDFSYTGRWSASL
jgi:hypothetical protein